MAYTFGAGSGDDITTTGPAGFGGPGVVAIVAGWFKPTTLSTGRYYWSAGNVIGLSVGGTTSEVAMTLDHATTDGVWTSSGAGIITDVWHFIAVAVTCQNAPSVVMSARLWVGSQNGFAEIPMSQTTAPVGGASSSTSRTIGNRGTGSLAFQGQIGWVTYIIDQGTDGNLFRLVTSGQFTNDEADRLRLHVVEPLYYGRPPQAAFINGRNSNMPEWDVYLLDQSVALSRRVLGTGTANALTINGATVSAERPPIAFPMGAIWNDSRAVRR